MIEDLSKCNYKAPSEASGSSSRLRGSGMHTAHEVGEVKEGIRNSAEGPVGEEPYQVEETKYISE